MAVYPTKPAPAVKPIVSAQVTPEVTEPVIVSPSRPIIGIAPKPLFEVTTEDAPEVVAPVPHVRKVSPKTLAEHAAGREAISQYAPASE